MIAVFVNMAAVIIGSLAGILFRRRISKRYTDTIVSALGLITAVTAIMSAVKSQNFLCLVICMVAGTAFGTLLKIEERINGAGELIKSKLLRGKDTGGNFAEGFVSACVLFCVGSMTVTGSFEAGINHDYSIIFTKSALDFVSSLIMGAALGFGVTCSALFILVFQGGLTLLSGVLAPLLDAETVTEMSAVGGAVLIGTALNILDLSPKKIATANMIPAVLLPMVYMPLERFIGGLIG